jgi:hypothetical protein
MSSTRSKIGRCRLTGVTGKYVRSHIIPRSLTIEASPGSPLIQQDVSGRHIRRWTSWYDDELVTQEGEDILQGYDDWGKKFLRQHKLLWTSWGKDHALNAPDFHNLLNQFGYRKLANIDGKMLRLFLLSLLWRVAATNLPEFRAVDLSAQELESLRLMVLNGQTEPAEFFPISLTQLSTRNVPHNFAAETITKREPVLDPITLELVQNQYRVIDAYRLFFDGLVVHFNINVDKQYVMDRAQMIVDGANELFITTVESSESRQIKRLNFETGTPELTATEIAEEWEDRAENDYETRAWDALNKIVEPISILGDGDEARLSVSINYQKYLDSLQLLRNAWLKRGPSIDYYREIALLLLQIFARKAATAITQGLIGSGKARNNNLFYMYVDATEGEARERFLLLSWRVTRKLGESVNWSKLNDSKFPKAVLDYTFSNEYIKRLEAGPLKLLGWRPPTDGS